MTREDLLQEFLSLKGNNFLLELPTGVGKTRIALEKLKQKNLESGTLLIVISRLVHKETWSSEINKWWDNCPLFVEFTTYNSLAKHVGSYTAVIYDEVQHLSPNSQTIVPAIKAQYTVMCSATIPFTLREKLQVLFYPLTIFRKSLRSITNEGILPTPLLYLLPLHLSLDELKEYRKIDDQVSYWKKRYMSSYKQWEKNKWLQTAGTRLKWLSSHKINIAKAILIKLKDYRTITFCNTIEQTEQLGKYCIHSKNKQSKEFLKLFNDKQLDHITSCDMLNESTNLVDCQIGLFVNLNSSEIITKQRLGRILRHPNPVIIIPYYVNTRDEQLVQKIASNYDGSCVKIIKTIQDIKI